MSQSALIKKFDSPSNFKSIKFDEKRARKPRDLAIQNARENKLNRMIYGIHMWSAPNSS